MSIATLAALIFVVVAGGIVVFQLALALGAPWGVYRSAGERRIWVPVAMLLLVSSLVVAFS